MNTTTPVDITVADIVDKAHDAIEANGFHRFWLYDEKQAGGGTPLRDCRIDVHGAINVAVHGTPRWVGGSDLVAQAEREITADCGMVSLAAWTTVKGRSKRDALALLKRTATRLRGAK